MSINNIGRFASQSVYPLCLDTLVIYMVNDLTDFIDGLQRHLRQNNKGNAQRAYIEFSWHKLLYGVIR